jgi:peptide/nickel transport system substrate-binding protein
MTRLHTPPGDRKLRARLRIVAIGLILALVAAACQPGDDADTDPTGTTGEGTGTTSGEPSGDLPERLVYGVIAPQVESNDIVREVQPQDDFQLKPLYENLIGNDPATGQWVPMLAESWEVEGDDLRMFLREGVEFHNGFGEFTAEDVLFTMDHLTDPPGALSGIADVVRDTAPDIEIVSDHEIIFHLTNASYEFLEALSYGATGTTIMSKADFDSRGGVMPALDEPPLAGTGPYSFVERTPGQNVVFARVENHWRQTPDFAELEYRYFNEASTMQSALLAGEVHITELPAELTEAAVAAGMEIAESQIPGTRIALNFVGAYNDPPGVGLDDPASCENPNDSPWWDVRLRRAVNKAIDRDTLNQAFFGGRGEPLQMWFWLPEITGWDPAWEERFDEEYGYDPEAASALLEEAGYGPGELTVTVLGTPNSGSPESGPVMEAVAGMLNDAGFDGQIEMMDDGEEVRRLESFFYDGQAVLEYDVFNSEVITGFDAQGYATHNSGRAVENCEIDAMYAEVLKLLTPDEQDEPWREMGHAVYDFVGHVPLFRVRVQAVFDPEVVSGYQFPGSGVGSLYSYVELIEAAG